MKKITLFVLSISVAMSFSESGRVRADNDLEPMLRRLELADEVVTQGALVYNRKRNVLEAKRQQAQVNSFDAPYRESLVYNARRQFIREITPIDKDDKRKFPVDIFDGENEFLVEKS